MNVILRLAACGYLLLFTLAVTAQDSVSAKISELSAGHSMHGETFNAGPRQRAYLMGGTGKVHLEVSTKEPDVQAFFDQGIGQLHGFWYFEAERSFRQAAFLDPDCAMAYWGMAMANVNNTKRAKGFMEKALAKKTKASLREQKWMDAYGNYWLGKKEEKVRCRDLVKALENLNLEFPDELEAKAFLAFHIWNNAGKGLPISSHLAVDALLKDIFAVEPMHPAHHYVIHLWDDEKPIRALESAACAGQTSPTIAHMWHMPGHTYSKLQRYADAAWQQEASARADHLYMMRDCVWPDQIHNYTHNNQWLVENFEYIGRAHDAVAVAKNLIELPRHPRYNTLGLKEDGRPQDKNNGSSGAGRKRLLETLTRYELWEELIVLADSMYLEPTDIPNEQVKRLRVLGVAHFAKGDSVKGRQQIQALEAMLQKLRSDRLTAADQAEEKSHREKKSAEQVGKAVADAMQKYSDRLPAIEAALAELRGLDFLSQGNIDKAAESIGQAKDTPRDRLARFWLQAGDKQKAEKLSREDAASGNNQVFRLANFVDVLVRCGKEKEARDQFHRLREASAFIDLDLPVMRRIAPLAKTIGLPTDWRVPHKPATDVGVRPPLEAIGPLHWHPVRAPIWSLPNEEGKLVSLRDYSGRPVIVIFFLGSGCPHCIEQLNAFEPFVQRFKEANISLVAVSTDTVAGLHKTFEKSKLPQMISIVSDEKLNVFRTNRVFDDFENQPLHGTFLIDAQGRLRWQDISYEPFKEVDFLLAEALRILR